MGKDANAPKRPMSGYFRYCQTIRKSVEAETGLRGIKIAPMLSQKWGELDATSKARLNQQSAAEMSVWKGAMESYRQTDDYKNFMANKQQKKAKKVKKMKDPNAPKRPSTAYFLYMKEVRPSVVDRVGSSDVTIVGKKIGQMWKNLSEEEKSGYMATADRMRAKWQEKLAAYKNSASFAAFQERKQAALPSKPVKAPKAKKMKKVARKVVRKVKK